ncbi:MULTISPECIES: MmcQ/YjbR family DNA-binding protein [Pedobacter]|uniref:MmcQ/YjbR family DNA-binding protein n=1 Tax=Pedobacter TaxID=84567 RepID=UPI001E312AF3|nr:MULTISPECIES: MmcQ/YjbR family DNA-binding protein [Pedobacter]
MADLETFKQFSLSFPNTVEAPHFEKTSFRVKGKIFATLNIDQKLANLKFSIADQQQFCALSKSIYPVNGSWGKSGWTSIEIENLRDELLLEALESAYNEVAQPKKK